jgi:hypothetical protein
MFSTINKQFYLYIYLYKHIQLQTAFKNYLNNKITDNDFMTTIIMII